MNYEKVPTIISTKDLDYLEDMFNWNYLAYKKMINSIDMINNLEIEETIDKDEGGLFEKIIAKMIRRYSRNSF